MKLRVGLIGLGDVWQVRHAPALRALTDRFEVRAVCDQVWHRAEQVAAEFHAEAVDGYRALVQREDIDAVLVLAPQWYGSLPVLAACDSGKAIYCAVGLHLDAEEAKLIKRRVEGSGIAFVAEFPKRQAPATIRLKELIATKLGDPQLIFCHQRRIVETPEIDPLDHGSPHPMFQSMLGQFNWCHYVVDREPTSVTGVIHHSADDVEDYQMMSLDFSPRGKYGIGPLAQISCGRYIPAGWHEAISYRPSAMLQVSCKKGVAFLDLPATLVWFDESGRHQESLESERPIGEQLLINFYRSVTSLLRKTSDLEDAYLALTVTQAARQSHEEGRRVEL